MHKFIFFVLLLIHGFVAFAQTTGTPGKVRIKIVKADALRHDDAVGKNTQSLNGSVVLSHVNTFLHCDSAYMYNDSNLVHAYGNVHIIQNDSIHLYGDYLEYEGNSNLAKMRRNVRANKGTTWLYTEFLDYDRATNVGYFYNDGKVVNLENVLTSELGYYYPNSNEVFFKDSVVVTTPDYKMYGDTMRYNTQTEIVKILGPTHMLNDSTTIYSEDGWYDTRSNVSQLLKNSYIQGKEHLLQGDSIFYDRNSGLGEVFGNMALHDTTNHIVVKGNYGYYNELTKFALATGRAQMLQISGLDTLFMHADTFKVDPLPLEDSRIIRAYHNVKFYRFDLQGRCDSLVYDFRDSTSTMFHQPVVWAQGNQMTAQQVKMFMKNQLLHKVELLNTAFVIAPEDTSGYNQVKGKLMTGYIRNNELYRLDVDGNSQTIYYPKDDEQLIGINRAESSNMTLFMKQKKISDIIMRVSPAGNMNPLFILPTAETQLNGFMWLDNYRPKSKDDIFLKLEIPASFDRVDEFDGYEYGEI